MKNIKKYNNNIILADDNGLEVIILGKGLGFDAKQGDDVDMSLVEKVFVPQETAAMNRFKDILADLPYEYVILASKIVDYGKERLEQPLNQSIVVALADHLTFAIKRLHDHLDIQMPLAWEIQHIYPAEFAIGEASLKIIEQEISILFPQAEAAAIAMHFINAESDLGDMSNTFKTAAIIKSSVEIAESSYNMVFDENSSDFIGFVTFLRNTIARFMYNTSEKQAEEDTVLYDLLRKHYSFAFACAEKISAAIEKEQRWQFTRNDVSFLTLYISRVAAKK